MIYALIQWDERRRDSLDNSAIITAHQRVHVGDNRNQTCNKHKYLTYIGTSRRDAESFIINFMIFNSPDCYLNPRGGDQGSRKQIATDKEGTFSRGLVNANPVTVAIFVNQSFWKLIKSTVIISSYITRDMPKLYRFPKRVNNPVLFHLFAHPVSKEKKIIKQWIKWKNQLGSSSGNNGPTCDRGFSFK